MKRYFFSLAIFLMCTLVFAQCPTNEADLSDGGTFSGDCPDVATWGGIDINGTVNWTSGSPTVNGNLRIFGGLNTDLGTNFTVNGNIGARDGSNSTVDGIININGNWNINGGATFAGTGLVTYTGSVGGPNGGGLGTLTGGFAGCGGGGSCGDTALPVDLVSFTVESSTGGVKVYWETASELNNDYFSVQRSANGNEFYELAKIDGNGTTTPPKEYSFTDPFPLTSASYYRLVQVDFDGTFEVFNSVVFVAKDFIGTPVQISPNPVAQEVRILTESSVVYRGVRIIDPTGRTVFIKKFEGTGNERIVSLPYFKSGIYFLELQNEGSLVVRQRILVR